jgi:hypothetical protein
MICPHCHREIDIAAEIWKGVKYCARKCIFCGALLGSSLHVQGQASLPQGPQPPTQQQMMFIGDRAANVSNATPVTISFKP